MMYKFQNIETGYPEKTDQAVKILARGSERIKLTNKSGDRFYHNK